MKTTLITLATALALGLAGCDRNPAPNAKQSTGTSGPASSAPSTAPGSSSAGSSGAPNAPTANTTTTPANAGAPSQAEKNEGAVPHQGQVDPKQPEQRKDFERKPGG